MIFMRSNVDSASGERMSLAAASGPDSGESRQRGVQRQSRATRVRCRNVTCKQDEIAQRSDIVSVTVTHRAYCHYFHRAAGHLSVFLYVGLSFQLSNLAHPTNIHS